MSILSALSFDTRKISNESLRRFNLSIAGLLLAQAVAIILTAPTATRSVQTSFLAQDAIASQSAGHKVLLDATQHTLDVNPVYLAYAALLVAAATYATLATFRRPAYQQDLASGTNSPRWSIGGISPILMTLAAALFIGVGELGLLLAVGVAGAAVQLMASANEKAAGSKSIGWRQNPAIWLSYFITVAIPALYLWGAYVYGAPPSVYQYAVFLVLAAYSALMVVWSSRPKVQPKDYARRERDYSLASFVGLSALAWLIFAGLR